MYTYDNTLILCLHWVQSFQRS